MGISTRFGDVPMSLVKPPNSEPLETLLRVYRQRGDLQQAFRETAAGDYRRLISWAERVANGRGQDSSYAVLCQHAQWYTGQARRGRTAAAALNSWRMRANIALKHVVARLRGDDVDIVDVTDGGERVTPDVSNDVFVAHLSIYDFARRYVKGKSVLDAGCGTGYGSHYLLTEGCAARVRAIDISPKAIRYCREHYPRVSFVLGGVSDPAAIEGSYEFIFCSNVLEHVPEIDRVLGQLSRTLEPGGSMLIAVPPITSEADLLDNFKNPYHLNNYHVRQWAAKVSRFFREVTLFSHNAPEGVQLDFSSGDYSVHSAKDFAFSEVPNGEFLGSRLTAIFVASCPRTAPMPETTLEQEFPANWDIGKLWVEAEPDRRKVFEATRRENHYDDLALRSRIYPINVCSESRAASASASNVVSTK